MHAFKSRTRTKVSRKKDDNAFKNAHFFSYLYLNLRTNMIMKSIREANHYSEETNSCRHNQLVFSYFVDIFIILLQKKSIRISGIFRKEIEIFKNSRFVENNHRVNELSVVHLDIVIAPDHFLDLMIQECTPLLGSSFHKHNDRYYPLYHMPDGNMDQE